MFCIFTVIAIYHELIEIPFRESEKQHARMALVFFVLYCVFYLVCFIRLVPFRDSLMSFMYPFLSATVNQLKLDHAAGDTH